MSKRDTQKQARATMDAGSALPDYEGWYLDDVERHCEGLRKRMLAALTQAIRIGLKDAARIKFDGTPKKPLTMTIQLPGLRADDDLIPEWRFSLAETTRYLALIDPAIRTTHLCHRIVECVLLTGT
jgi:hypothetical protein